MASAAGSGAVLAVESGIGAAVDGGRAGSGGGAAELDAVDRPQSSPQPWP